MTPKTRNPKFPVATKLRAVAGAASRRRPVVVVNGAEGEPLSSKDRLLLVRAPHLVIDGAAVAAAAVGADRVHLCVESRDDAAFAAIRAALAERNAREPLGFDLRVEAAPVHYVGSEERSKSPSRQPRHVKASPGSLSSLSAFLR